MEGALLQSARETFAATAPIACPENMRPLRRAKPADAFEAELRQLGRDLLARGQVAVLMLAGGRSRRMGGIFRGDVPVGPVTDRTVLDLHGEQIAAVRARRSPDLKWIILTSASTNTNVRRALNRRAHYGLSVDDVWLLQQQSLPVLTKDLTPVRSADGTLICAPTGHGGVLDAVRRSDVVDRLLDLGVKHLFAFQYPNAMEEICDTHLLGIHSRGAYDATVKGVAETAAEEQVGHLIEVSGRVEVVEYHALATPEQRRWLETMPMNSGTSVWSLSFLQRCVRRGTQLPFWALPHAEVGVEAPAWRLEQFLFDLLPLCDTSGAVVVPRAGHYAAIKRHHGADTVAAARNSLTARYRAWLDQAGCIANGDVRRLEISSAFALDADELSQRLPRGFEYGDGLVLDAAC